MMQLVALALVFSLLVLNSCSGKRSGAYREAIERETAAGARLPSQSGEKPKPAPSPGAPVPAKKVDGEKNHREFTQEGVASWYGKDAKSRTTANGELYDPFALTAAHRTLPLGVYVRVRNQESGHEIVARINDRGPYVKYRILDLSLSAAQQLVVGSGAKVRLQALGFRNAGSANNEGYHSPETYDRGNFSVQVASFKDQQSADRLAGQLRKLFGQTVVRGISDRGVLAYQVHVGKYTSLKAAEEAEKKFGAHGYPQCFVISLD